MESVNLENLIEEVISKFSQNRIGDKPPVFVTMPPALRHIRWQDRSLKALLRSLLYETLLTNNPDASLEVVIHRKSELKDLAKFVGVNPLYWLQLRLSGPGLRSVEDSVEEIFTNVGYRCEEWVGVEKSNARLAIFSPVNKHVPKIVFCLEATSFIRRCDLLLPVSDTSPVPHLA